MLLKTVFVYGKIKKILYRGGTMYNFYAEFTKDGVSSGVNTAENNDFMFSLTEENGRIKGTITAHADLTFRSLSLTAEREFGFNDLFYANGYQAWTTSREFCRSDKLRGIMPFSKVSKRTEDITGISGDYRFASYGKQGVFHSYTYCYFRKRGDRTITLFGSKSECRGFTVFEADMNENTFKIYKDIEGLKLKKGDVYEVFDIIEINGEFDSVMDEYFFGFVGCKKPKVPHLSGYTSWYNYFQKINEQIILRDLDGMDRAKEEVNIFQVDDGYESAVGDWLRVDGEKFPNGMKYIADKIHEKGYKAGIWLAPFNAQRNSAILAAHPDWVIKDNETGKPLLGCIGWGGAYTFDIYNEEFRNYLKIVFDTYLGDWGYDMVKLDFLYSQCMQPRNGKTRGEIMCDAVDLLRSLCGDKLILGCGVPLGACMGIFDACRIGPDATKEFAGPFYNKFGINCEVPSCENAINNAIFRSHLDGRAFTNDPDVFFLRNTNIKFNLEQKLLLGKINAVCGNVLFVSDNAGDYDEKTVDFLKAFFKEKDYKVTMAEYVSRDVILLEFSEDGVQKSLKFNIKNGNSNIGKVV